MTQPLNPAKEKIRNGGVITAFMVTMPSVAVVQAFAAAGPDVLIIDMEHGAIDMRSLHEMVAATRGSGAVPIVRIPGGNHALVKPVLDTGAMGINFPMVASAEEARAAVAAMRYPPQGQRGFAPCAAPLRWGLSLPAYLAAANDAMLNVITIETPEAVARLDEIVAVPGIDVAAIASFDLSMSLGVPGQFDHPQVAALVGQAEASLRRAGMPMGGVALTAEVAAARRAAGYRMLLLGFDVALVEQAARQAVGFGKP